MDNGETSTIEDAQNGEPLNISDVFEAITLADPTFGAMAQPYVQIVEQPASKALRFRYECEGRSAGSIPGVNSTSENKTYPTIKIHNYIGQVVIVVSCVTKDKPYKTHPHSLVGRERCHKGVCTIPIRISEDCNEYQFKNLGIQCVKRRDIAKALAVRQDIKVDPFRTGFDHMEHPQAIDLNAVRLCFQVFLPNATGQCRRPLTPVVSEIIYDKKAMSDLLIVRASHCSGPARGGTQVIILCEKVTREDTVVVFFLEDKNDVVWEETANTMLVHKQVAIVFETPAFRDKNIAQHVTVRFQLKRVTDNARSNSVPFEYCPDFPGTARKPLPDLSIFSLLLNDKRTDTNNNKEDKSEIVSSTTDTVSVIVSDESETATITDVNGNLQVPELEVDANEKSLNDLLDQVAELDEIYSENRTRLENISSMNNDSVDTEDFNDAGTYTSLQLAFKNPVQISEPDPMSYEDVQVQTFRGPIIDVCPLKRDTDDERAPPLPPKRVRKATSTEPFKSSQTSVDSILKPGRQLPITRNLDTITVTEKPLSVARSEPALPPVKKRSFFSRLFRRKEKSPAPSVKSEGKKESKKSKPCGRSVSSVSGQRPSKFKSSVSHTSLKDNASGTGLSYADSITHISLHGDDNEKSASQTSLKRPASLAPLPPTDGGTILVAESVLALDANAFKKLQDDLDLTDAEHYALYMAVAPHATVSEFDETSCYYSPIDGNMRYKRKKVSSILESYESERGLYQPDQTIKSEPRDKTPPYLPQYGEQWPAMAVPGSSTNPFASEIWGEQSYVQHPSVSPNVQPVSPPMHMQNLHSLNPNVQSVYSMQPMSPNNPMSPPMMSSHGQTMSPHGQTMSPHGQTMSPHGQTMSPHRQALSPLGQAMSPHGQTMSPHAQQTMSPHGQTLSPHPQALSPHGQVLSPYPQTISPNMQVMSPQHIGRISPNMQHQQNLGHISPNLVQQPVYVQQMQQQNLMDTDNNSTPSLSTLLDRGEGILINSGELSGLSSLLGD